MGARPRANSNPCTPSRFHRDLGRSDRLRYEPSAQAERRPGAATRTRRARARGSLRRTPSLSPLRAKARMTRIKQNNEKAAYLKTAFPEHSGGNSQGVQLRWVRVRGATRTPSLSITTPSLPPPMRLFGLLARSSSLMPGRTRPISSSPQPNGTRFSVKHILEEQPERRAPTKHRPSGLSGRPRRWQ